MESTVPILQLVLSESQLNEILQSVVYWLKCSELLVAAKKKKGVSLSGNTDEFLKTIKQAFILILLKIQY